MIVFEQKIVFVDAISKLFLHTKHDFIHDVSFEFLQLFNQRVQVFFIQHDIQKFSNRFNVRRSFFKMLSQYQIYF